MKIKNLAAILGLGVLGFNNLYSQEETKNHIYIKKNEISDSLHLTALKKYAPITEKNDTLDLFAKLNPGLKEYLTKAYIIDEKDFFNELYQGHAHKSGGVICLSKDYADNESFFHEAGHIRHLKLDSLVSGFSNKWKQIVNFEYGEHNLSYSLVSRENEQVILMTWKDDTIKTIKNGLLNPYSSKHIYEDVATFVGCLGYELTPEKIVEFKEPLEEFVELEKNFIKAFQNIHPLYFADTTDHRYKQKLDLLKEYNFFTKEEHEKLSKDLGILRYLLKEKK